jgi:hypothetical protein
LRTTNITYYNPEDGKKRDPLSLVRTIEELLE